MNWNPTKEFGLEKLIMQTRVLQFPPVEEENVELVYAAAWRRFEVEFCGGREDKYDCTSLLYRRNYDFAYAVARNYLRTVLNEQTVRRKEA